MFITGKEAIASCPKEAVAAIPTRSMGTTNLIMLANFLPLSRQNAGLNIARSYAHVCRDTKTAGATIAFMAKFRPAKAKKQSAPPPQGAIPCVVMVILAIVGVMALLFFVMKSSSGS